jgi:hypothetical protein
LNIYQVGINILDILAILAISQAISNLYILTQHRWLKIKIEIKIEDKSREYQL